MARETGRGQKEKPRDPANVTREQVLGEPPLEEKGPEVTPIARDAAGIPAIWNTLKFGLRGMGVMKTTRSLLAINKETGFDCQSCAWPSPEPGHRKAFEFCENGAKRSPTSSPIVAWGRISSATTR